MAGNIWWRIDGGQTADHRWSLKRAFLWQEKTGEGSKKSKNKPATETVKVESLAFAQNDRNSEKKY